MINIDRFYGYILTRLTNVILLQLHCKEPLNNDKKIKKNT